MKGEGQMKNNSAFVMRMLKDIGADRCVFYDGTVTYEIETAEKNIISSIDRCFDKVKTKKDFISVLLTECYSNGHYDGCESTKKRIRKELGL